VSIARENSEMFLKKLFSVYYENKSLYVPMHLEKREFGFFLFEKGIMLRHVSFRTHMELQNYVKTVVPRHIYYSSAFYELPSMKTMNEKKWIGAELIFDIDADHINTPCKKVHDKWTCLDCGHSGFGLPPKRCPVCKSTKIKHDSWICEKCLAKAKEETVKIIEEFLMNDFGISKSEITVFYSGHRGYHIHVNSDFIYQLGQSERREIANYILGINIIPEYHGFLEITSSGKNILLPPQKNDIGWRGRLITALISVIKNIEFFEDVPLSKKKLQIIKSNKQQILHALSMNPPHLKAVRGLNKHDLRSLIVFSAKIFGGKIDAPVTADIKRLIRLPNSLHGKTGFIVKAVPLSEIDSFNPLVDAIAFTKGEVTLKLIDSTPSIIINNETYGPYKKDAYVTVPLSVGVYLLARGKAELGGDINVSEGIFYLG